MHRVRCENGPKCNTFLASKTVIEKRRIAGERGFSASPAHGRQSTIFRSSPCPKPPIAIIHIAWICIAISNMICTHIQTCAYCWTICGNAITADACFRTRPNDTVSEWLRRWTRNPLGSARRGSNPLGVELAVVHSNLPIHNNTILIVLLKPYVMCCVYGRYDSV